MSGSGARLIAFGDVPPGDIRRVLFRAALEGTLKVRREAGDDTPVLFAEFHADPGRFLIDRAVVDDMLARYVSPAGAVQ